MGGPGWGGSDGTGLLPSPARYLNNELHPTPVGPPTQATMRRPKEAAAFQIELVPLHSPLLGESWLVSFPPLINMFKFSGSSCSSSALCGFWGFEFLSFQLQAAFDGCGGARFVKEFPGASKGAAQCYCNCIEARSKTFEAMIHR